MNSVLRKIVTGLKAAVLLAVLGILPACGGSDSTTTTAVTTGKLSVRMVGVMPPDLADEIDQEFVKASADSAAPLLISQVDLGTLSAAERSAIKTTFDNDIPVILVRPTRTQREALRSLVGLAGTDLSDDIPEFWGLQTSKKFEIWEYVFASPAARQVSDTDFTTMQTDGTSQTTDGPAIEDYLFDMPEHQLSRVAGLREWLALAPGRSTGQTAAATASKAADDPKAILEQTILSDYAPTNFSYLSNRYAVSLSSRSVYQTGNSYFIITALGLLNASSEFEATTSADERNLMAQMTPNDASLVNTGRIASKYAIRFLVPNAQSQEVTEVSKVLPASDTTSVEITNALEWSLGGKVTGGIECTAGSSAKDGKSGECTAKVGGEISGGVRTSESRKFTKKDVVITNKSTPGAPAWSFEITPPKLTYNWLQFPYWYRPAIVATSTFQPEMTWVWKVSDTLRQRYPNGLPVTVELTPTLYHGYTRYAGWWTAYFTDLYPQKPFTTQVTLPWPPTTAAK